MCTQLKVHAIARAAQPAGAQEHAVLKGPCQVAIAWVMVLRILPPQALLAEMAGELLLSSCYLLELLLAKIIWMLSSAQVTFHILFFIIWTFGRIFPSDLLMDMYVICGTKL